MASQFDESDFVDSDFVASHQAAVGAGGYSPASAVAGRPPTREELDAKVSEAQQRLADLRRAQEQLERERSALEEGRRRRIELQTGREEMLQHLTRGVELLQETEFGTRRDAEQMAKTLHELRDALGKVQGIQEETWTQENWNTELTRALAAIENARMEWNGARLKWPLLNGEMNRVTPKAESSQDAPARRAWSELSFLEICRIGLGLTWPVALIAALGFTAIALILWR